MTIRSPSTLAGKPLCTSKCEGNQNLQRIQSLLCNLQLMWREINLVYYMTSREKLAGDDGIEERAIFIVLTGCLFASFSLFQEYFYDFVIIVVMLPLFMLYYKVML